MVLSERADLPYSPTVERPEETIVTPGTGGSLIVPQGTVDTCLWSVPALRIRDMLCRGGLNYTCRPGDLE
jgi:hypothetical protein